MAQLTIQQAFDLATTHHQAGRLTEALQLYQQILIAQPTHAEAMYRLALIAHQSGQRDVAIDMLRKSIAINPNWPPPLEYLGNLFLESGQLDEAIQAYQQAIALNSKSPETRNNLGIALGLRGQLDDAIAAFGQAITLKPQFADAHNNLGNALKEKGKLEEAVIACRQAIALAPDHAGAHNNLGNALRDLGQTTGAIAACRRAIALQPDFSKAHNNLGNALTDHAEFESAIDAYRRAIELNANDAMAHNNLGLALIELRKLDEAMIEFRKAITIQPDLPDAHFNISQLLLHRGDYIQGWKEQEWRWLCNDIPKTRMKFSQPLWDGADVANRTILIHSEQGFGDIIQFSRFIPLVAERGGKVIVVCPPSLQRLLQSLPGVHQCISWGQTLPAFDVQCPLLSLPLVFNTTLQSLPNSVRYLHAESDTIEKWKKELSCDSNRLKIGVAWAGRPLPRYRSIPIDVLARLNQVASASFYSLQKQSPHLPPKDFNLIDLTESINDFSDTAALISNLDLVISIDTAAAHLAGAMGKPIWTMIKFSPDWRWQLDRSDNPWYPTMRLFRQPRLGDWDSVIRDVIQALSGPPLPIPERRLV